jgi:hypothetical protein
MSASLSVQQAIRSRLVATSAVTALVPASNILDRNALPAPDPSIIIGEDQEVDDGDLQRRRIRIYSTVHVWKRERGLTGVKAIAGAIRTAVQSGRIVPIEGFHVADCHIAGTRYLRDPDGETAHAVITIETLVQEMAT